MDTIGTDNAEKRRFITGGGWFKGASISVSGEVVIKSGLTARTFCWFCEVSGSSVELLLFTFGDEEAVSDGVDGLEKVSE
ncbi:hypothetical protein WICPIJ_003367 [Wickerhamomyces pijperi]|uniref:Uncharacterized protein n=1 Tax=Wickerhamomyces pijperi TaxID=599730 RepID=A0A9P8TN35_WICPI|nr:hypothetical protein WICPIJ_003367 [Wickerhamomyces pijperi]